jgi:hypothetical protein
MLKLSDRELAKEFGISPQKLGRCFKEAKIKTGRGIQHSIQQAYESLSKILDVKKATELARLNNLDEDFRRKKFENLEMEKTLVRLEEAIELTTKPWRTISRILKDWPAKLSTRCNPMDPDLPREEISEAVRELMVLMEENFEKLKPK